MTKLTFLGTGTSQGVPMIACGCEVCSSSDTRDKRLRTSALVEHGGITVVIDAGPDFRQQMLRENVKHIDGILLTHEHKDHINGLDDIRAFNYTTGKPVRVYAEKRVQDVIRKDFDFAFGEKRYPGAPEFDLVEIEDPFTVANADGSKSIDVIPVRGKHYMLPVLGFRTGNLVYITDMNSIEESEMEKIRGVDTLVINALQKKRHLSHFSLDEALQISRMAGARTTYLTHVSHSMGLFSQIESELPDNVHFAYDGLHIEIKD